MHLPFSLRGIAGHVDITVDITQNPEDLGAMPEAIGLPHCHATIDYPGRGYGGCWAGSSLCGQRTTTAQGSYTEMDPLTLVGEVAHPFAFFGVTPTLFDAPARHSRADLDWLAHSFLCYIKDDGQDVKTVQAITGFSWGFTIAAAATTADRRVIRGCRVQGRSLIGMEDVEKYCPDALWHPRRRCCRTSRKASRRWPAPDRRPGDARGDPVRAGVRLLVAQASRFVPGALGAPRTAGSPSGSAPG